MTLRMIYAEARCGIAAVVTTRFRAHCPLTRRRLFPKLLHLQLCHFQCGFQLLGTCVPIEPDCASFSASGCLALVKAASLRHAQCLSIKYEYESIFLDYDKLVALLEALIRHNARPVAV